LLLTKEVEVELGGKNIKWYENKGYEIPKRKDKWGRTIISKNTTIKVKIEDLSSSSHVKINIQCDECGKILDGVIYQSYKRNIHKNNKYYCRKCAVELFGKEKIKQTKLNKSGTIVETHPHLIKHFVNEEDAYKYSVGSGKKILMKCPDCKFEKEVMIRTIAKYGFSCPKCSDHISFCEKFLCNIFQQLNIKFIKELSQTTFKWCDKYRYDFYIPELNCIIETHGEQHYKESKGNWGSLQEIQENDKLKYKLALDNRIKYYIVLNCCKSNLDWIKNNIMQSELPMLLNFKKEDINWLMCYEYSCGSLIKKTCDLWNEGLTNTKEIGDKLNFTRSTAINYLKKGVELGWCDYDSKEEMKKNGRKINQIFVKSVICLNTNKIFTSIKEAAEYYNMKNSSGISSCCTGKQKSAGKHPITLEKLRWSYYNESMGDLKFAN
jgi:ribosomal protein S27E